MLVVDDNASIALLLSIIFSELDFDVHVALSGEEAVDMINSSFDFVFTDMHMHKMNGNDVARIAKACNKKVITVLCYSPLRVEPDMYLFDHIFFKPVDIKLIAATMKCL